MTVTPIVVALIVAAGHIVAALVHRKHERETREGVREEGR